RGRQQRPWRNKMGIPEMQEAFKKAMWRQTILGGRSLDDIEKQSGPAFYTFFARDPWGIWGYVRGSVYPVVKGVPGSPQYKSALLPLYPGNSQDLRRTIKLDQPEGELGFFIQFDYGLVADDGGRAGKEYPPKSFWQFWDYQVDRSSGKVTLSNPHTD